MNHCPLNGGRRSSLVLKFMHTGSQSVKYAFQYPFVKEYDTKKYQEAVTKEELCKVKHKQHTTKHALSVGKNITLSKNIINSKDWEDYCLSSKSDHIISCPDKILKTIKDAKVHQLNKGFEKYRKKLERKAAIKGKSN